MKVNLQDDCGSIESFLVNATQNFERLHGPPQTIGIYSCPHYMWVSVNFNLTHSLSETGQNCPDYQFVEFDFIEFANWESSYELGAGTIVDVCGETIEIDEHLSDANYDKPFYHAILSVALKLKSRVNNTEVFVQILDSNYALVI